MPTLEQIHGHVLKLVREHLLRDPGDDSAYEHSFFAGRKNRPFFGIGLTWWITERGRHTLHDLAAMATEIDPSLKGHARNIEQAIENVFKEELEDRQLFNLGRLHLAATLFDLVRPAPADFAAEMWRRIHAALRGSILSWIVVLPLPRVTSDSASLGFDGLTLLRSTDVELWSTIASRYSDAPRWNPSTGQRRDVERDARFFGNAVPPTWLLAEVNGNIESAKENAYRAARTFVALLFAHLRTTPGLLVKTAARIAGGTTQFPSDSRRAGCGQSMTLGGAILPSLAIDIAISPQIIGELQRWYASRLRSAPEQQKRATTASQFIHYAIMSDGLVRFIHFFVALDALFGVRGDVEQTITAGIRHAFNHEPQWHHRARKLMRLRNELLHGGSSTIEDWPELGFYSRHFRSDPLSDVGVAAMTALVRFFDLPSTLRRSRPKSKLLTLARLLPKRRTRT